MKAVPPFNSGLTISTLSFLLSFNSHNTPFFSFYWQTFFSWETMNDSYQNHSSLSEMLRTNLVFEVHTLFHFKRVPYCAFSILRSEGKGVDIQPKENRDYKQLHDGQVQVLRIQKHIKTKPCGLPELFAFQHTEWEIVGSVPILNPEADQHQQN